MKKLFFAIVGVLFLLYFFNCAMFHITTALKIPALTRAAEAGDVDAQVRLGLYYGTGRGVIKNEKKSLKWIYLAAMNGDVSSQQTLGIFYWRGDTVPQDKAEALKWFRKAAEQGDSWSIERVKQLEAELR